MQGIIDLLAAIENAKLLSTLFNSSSSPWDQIFYCFISRSFGIKELVTKY